MAFSTDQSVLNFCSTVTRLQCRIRKSKSRLCRSTLPRPLHESSFSVNVKDVYKTSHNRCSVESRTVLAGGGGWHDSSIAIHKADYVSNMAQLLFSRRSDFSTENWDTRFSRQDVPQNGPYTAIFCHSDIRHHLLFWDNEIISMCECVCVCVCVCVCDCSYDRSFSWHDICCRYSSW